MKLSSIIFSTEKESTNLDKGTDRLIRGGFIQKECSGIFRFNVFGVRMLNKIKKIIKEEMESIDCHEVSLPALQDSDLWKKSGRFDSYGKELFSLKDRKDHLMFLAPTAEESATELIKNQIHTYKQLPIRIFQTLEKYRDEIRPRFGLIRSRQFIMKDAYSFDKDESEAQKTYKYFFQAYEKIFKRMDIAIYAVASDVGEIGGSQTHEFVAIDSDNAESDLFFNNLDEITRSMKDYNLKLPCSFDQGTYKNNVKCLELGQIFLLGTKYSEAMNATFKDQDQNKNNFFMGCYGIGVTRILAYLAETKKVFSDSVSPFRFHLVSNNTEQAESFYEEIKHMDILWDNREYSIGLKMCDADLIGCPYRIIIGNNFEFMNCLTREVKCFDSRDDLKNYVENFNKNI